MAARDGDGWVECSCGSKHWGLHGAAGLLIYRDGAILLQYRAPWVHNGDTWGIPGGARDSHESVIDGAVHGIGKMALGSGSFLRKSQTGFVRSYAALILIGAVALIAAIWVVTT